VIPSFRGIKSRDYLILSIGSESGYSKTGILLEKNRSLIDPDPVFNHDPDRDENFSIRV